ncbi:MAG: AAA family ATPase [Actinomycetota bacterium]
MAEIDERTAAPQADRNIEPDLLNTELGSEQKHVDLCYATLEKLRVKAEANLQSTMDLKVSTPQSVFEREVFASYSRKRLRAVSGSEHQLVFGRLDLEDEDKPAYVGRIGLANEEQERILIDWRAPVGSSFYRATALAPRGVVRRRTLITRGRRVVDINDDVLIPAKVGSLGVVAGEGALMNALMRERGEFMQDIVATIQSEQDEVIRTDPKSSILLTGGPGTGKSVVALHRTAYLMYERAAELERLGVLVVGPGRRFSKYISRVLPSLGETAVSIRSVFDLTDPVVAAGREPLGVARIKGSAAMAKVLKTYLIESYPAPGTEVRVGVGGRIVKVGIPELNALRSQVLSSRKSGLNSATDQLWLALARRILQLSGSRSMRKGDVAALSNSLRDRSDLEDLIDTMLPQREALSVWRELSSNPDVLLAALRPHLSREEAAELVRDLDGADPRVGDLALIDEIDWLLGPSQDAEVPGREEPGYEELITAQERLDESRQRSVSSSKSTGYGHVVVDEAQDITAMQWRMLMRRGEDATWTIVGDPSQATLAAPADMEAAVDRLLGRGKVRKFNLGINYRTPREIMEYASRASGMSLANTRSIRSGPEPVFFKYADSPGDALSRAATWLRSQGGSGCFIAVNSADQQELEGRVDEFEIIWALDAKGLEFDNVVLYRPEGVDPSVPSDASLILIGATRATKRLAVVTRRISLS